jgi:hypothetical protein
LQQDAHNVMACHTLNNGTEGSWNLTLSQIVCSARGMVTLHLLQGWAEALSSKHLLSNTAALLFVAVFLRISLGPFFCFGAKRLGAFAAWAYTNSACLRAAANLDPWPVAALWASWAAWHCVQILLAPRLRQDAGAHAEHAATQSQAHQGLQQAMFSLYSFSNKCDLCTIALELAMQIVVSVLLLAMFKRAAGAIQLAAPR